MRTLFSDGINSLAHVAFGWGTNYYVVILPAFVLYQLVKTDENTPIDFAEYFIGAAVGKYCKK